MKKITWDTGIENCNCDGFCFVGCAECTCYDDINGHTGYEKDRSDYYSLFRHKGGQ